MSRKKRNTPFQPGHSLLYGLRPVQRDDTTQAVVSVACSFCEKFGREEKAGAKRRATQRVKHFKQPFRTENYHQHHSGQHRTRWAEYKQLTAEKKVAYLSSPGEIQGHEAYAHISDLVNETPEADVAPTSRASSPNVPPSEPVAKQRHVIRAGPRKESGGQMPISFTVIQPIVSLIGDLFVDTIHEKTTKERAISGFTTQTHPGINDYCVKIANLTLFDATIAFISNGATPRVATALVSEMFRATSTTVPPTRLVSDLSEARLAAYMRCVIAYNLQTLADVLRQKWTFSLSFAEVKHETNHYIDVGVRFCLGDDLHAFHILCCPLPNRFNKDEIVRSIYAVLDALHPSWKKSIIAVSTDGAEAAEVAAQELLVHLRPESSGALMHTWSGAHQLDLLVSSTIRTVLDESYFSSLNNLITFLHSQDSFMAETKSPCPKATVSSWLSIWAALEWLKLYRIRIVEVLEEKKTGFEPSAPWWILSMGLLEFVRAVAKTYNRIQGFTRLLSKQVSLLSELLRTLKRLSGCKGPITRDELGLLSQWDLITDGNYVVRKTTVQSFLTGLGSFVYVSANELPQSTVDGVVHAVSTLFLSSIVGLASIVESRKEPSAGADELCPVLPNELVKLSRTDFNRVLRNHADRLSPKMSCEDLDRTEEEFGRLTEACYREDVFNSSVQNVKSYSTFANAWGMLRGRFPLLYEFCGGIGSGYPGSFSKSVNFSVKGGHTELFRIRGMTDFPLEGSLHCQQYQKLKGLTMSCTPNEVAISSHLCR